MALIVFTSTSSSSPLLLSPSSSSSPSQFTSAITAANPSVCRLLLKKELRGLQPKAFNGLHMSNVLKSTRTQVIVKASAAAGIDGVEPEGGNQPPPPAADVVPVEDLPLESKQQLILEQRLKMKLAKKLRLRRKRLVRKRQLRKKGRWPPSKMKKNKNV